MKKSYWLSMKDGVDVHVVSWTNPQEQPKAIVQLSHGMVEHIERYDEFANFLLNERIFVFGNDHRGHGKTGQKQGILGYFAAEDGFTKTASDLFTITTDIKSTYPNIPLFLLGHSMGSFLARKYIQTHSHAIKGVILAGTGYYPTSLTMVGKQMASILPPTKKSKLMNQLAFGSNNNRIKGKITKFDWLTQDKEAVKAYIEDPLTGFVPTARFFYDLMSGLQDIHQKQANGSIRKDLPMLLISGAADPVGSYGKGVWKTAQLYEEAGLEKVTTMLYENGRHELLNELNKKEVYQAISGWISHILE
ncbi:alpha/beta hydrolase [Virgibacillus sp. LDC-1]|uniref:alpha/beta hydrolase n=1 Tax=Virgibacillus sp. LDC-1 TaxID=3039856 RepID=UPI0024DE27F2|nr:alpha/beta hydrolase [Virgibacillus sp. LDC-1]